MIKQLTPHGCGMYAVANALNFPFFVTDERLGKSKEFGNNIGQLSKWMQEDGNPYYIDAMYYNNQGDKLPDWVCNLTPSGENIHGLPILLQVRYSETGKNHLIGGKIAKDGTLYLYDSLKPDVIETRLEHVNGMYHNVYGLYIFIPLSGNGYVFI